ncbi:MAG: BCCT family transporter, partial [Balneolales bacterium]
MNLIENFKDAMNPPVFLGSVALILAFVIFGAGFSQQANITFTSLQQTIVSNFGWLYILSATGLLLFVIFLAVSRLGRIRLGGDEATPDFNMLTWFAMLLAAGMGIGLVFFGVAEPIGHYMQPLQADAQSTAAITD